MRLKNTTQYHTLVIFIGSLFLCGTPGSISAFHIIGGEITYLCQGDGSAGTKDYSFVMTLYRDCSGDGAIFDNPAEMGIYSLVDGIYEYEGSVLVSHGQISVVPPPDDPCLIVPNNVCVQRAVYNFNLNLAVINGSYLIFWRRCCRNESINNIVNPRDAGATFSVEITSRAQ